MAYMCTLVLLILPLVSLFFQFAVSAASIPLGQPCTTNVSCSTNDSNSECKGGICHCKATFYNKNNTCVVKKALGASCDATNPCKDVYAECKGNCTCKVSFYQDTNACHLRIKPNNTCGTPKNASCVANSYCNASSSLCVCGKDYTSISTGCIFNSAMTMAVVEISTFIMCFVLAYLHDLK